MGAVHLLRHKLWNGVCDNSLKAHSLLFTVSVSS